MYKDIDTYITRKCQCVKQKRPNSEDRALLVPIKSKYPFEIVSLDFLKVDKAKGGFEYVQHLQPKPNLQKQLQRICTTITYSHMGFHLKFIMIVDVNSITRHFKNYINFVVSNHQKPLHIILLGTEKMSG